MERLGSRIKEEFKAEDLVAELFSAHGWKVKRQLDIGPFEIDFLLRKGQLAYVAEVKAFSEGRPDRVIPILSQAIVQAQAYARVRPDARPLAIVYLGAASRSLVKQVQKFVGDFAQGVAVGVMADSGLRHFVGEGLEGLNADPDASRGPAKSAGRVPQLFSDLNQWMLKVLLAPEIPEPLLGAPRGVYRNASELAAAANVSLMSASRFIRQLRHEGYLDAHRLKLVRRADLFRRWQAAVLRHSPNELAMAFVLGGPIEVHLRQLQSRDAGLALFAAADALNLGHVSGVPPHVYASKWARPDQKDWPVLPAAGKPDFILREPSAPQSIFRGMVNRNGVPVCDAIQVWLDVSAHPSRGLEQADLIYRRVLRPIVEDSGR